MRERLPVRPDIDLDGIHTAIDDAIALGSVQRLEFVYQREFVEVDRLVDVDSVPPGAMVLEGTEPGVDPDQYDVELDLYAMVRSGDVELDEAVQWRGDEGFSSLIGLIEGYFKDRDIELRYLLASDPLTFHLWAGMDHDLEEAVRFDGNIPTDTIIAFGGLPGHPGMNALQAALKVPIAPGGRDDHGADHADDRAGPGPQEVGGGAGAPGDGAAVAPPPAFMQTPG